MENVGSDRWVRDRELHSDAGWARRLWSVVMNYYDFLCLCELADGLVAIQETIVDLGTPDLILIWSWVVVNCELIAGDWLKDWSNGCLCCFVDEGELLRLSRGERVNLVSYSWSCKNRKEGKREERGAELKKEYKIRGESISAVSFICVHVSFCDSKVS